MSCPMAVVNGVRSFKSVPWEAVQIDEDIPQVSMHRSWSDGDLAQLCEDPPALRKVYFPKHIDHFSRCFS